MGVGMGGILLQRVTFINAISALADRSSRHGRDSAEMNFKPLGYFVRPAAGADGAARPARRARRSVAEGLSTDTPVAQRGVACAYPRRHAQPSTR